MSNDITSFDSLWRSYKAIMRGKNDNPTALKFHVNAVARIRELQRQLEGRTFKVSRYYPFKVYEPKEREVLALDFVGKVVQHSLCENALYPAFSKRFIADNYAGQKGKGVHFGLDRLSANMRHYFFSRKAAREKLCRLMGEPLPTMNDWDYSDGWVLKADVSKYFYSIRHDIAREMAYRSLDALTDDDTRECARWLLDLFIDSVDDPGLPIGNQSSQLLGLLYLDGIDHWIKDDLGLLYGRYMDDMYVIHESKEYLQDLLEQLHERMADLGLSLNSKTQIFPLKNGIDFLGYHTYLTRTGKVVRKLRRKSKDNMRHKIKVARKLVDAGKVDANEIAQSYASWKGHAKHGNTYRLVNKMEGLMHDTFPELYEQGVKNGETTEQFVRRRQGEARKHLRRSHNLACCRQESQRVSEQLGHACNGEDHKDLRF